MALLDLPLREFLDEVTAEGRTPGGGSVAALVTAFAAGLLAKVARASGATWPEAPGIAAQAESLVARSAPLVQAAAEQYEAALQARAQSGEGQAARPDRERRRLPRPHGRAERRPRLARRCCYRRVACRSRGEGCRRAGSGEPHRRGRRPASPRGGESGGGGRPRRRGGAGGSGVDQAVRTAGRRAVRPLRAAVHRGALVLVAAARSEAPLRMLAASRS